MVSRVEVFLGLAIIFFATKEMITEVDMQTSKQVIQRKELELSYATLHEVNQSSIQNTITATQMIVYPNKTLFYDVNLTTNILRLSAKQAMLRGDMVIFDKNTTVNQSNGTQYYAKTLRYDKNKRQLVLPEKFSITNTYGEVNGSSMMYDSDSRSMKGKYIQGHYKMK